MACKCAMSIIGLATALERAREVSHVRVLYCWCMCTRGANGPDSLDSPRGMRPKSERELPQYAESRSAICGSSTGSYELL